MSERVTDPAYWITANGADTAEMAELIQSALLSPGDWGSVTVREEAGGKIVVGLVSTLVLPDEDAEMAFSLLLEDYAEQGDAD